MVAKVNKHKMKATRRSDEHKIQHKIKVSTDKKKPNRVYSQRWSSRVLFFIFTTWNCCVVDETVVDDVDVLMEWTDGDDDDDAAIIARVPTAAAAETVYYWNVERSRGWRWRKIQLLITQ